MNNRKHSKVTDILLHGAFWVLIWFFFNYFFSYNSDHEGYVIWFSTLLLPLTMLVTYSIVYFLIPKFLLVKKYIKFFLYSFYVIVVSSYLIVLIIYGCIIWVLNFKVSDIPPMGKNFVFILVLVYLVVGIVSTIGLITQNFRTVNSNKELQNKILDSQLQLKNQELNYLKMQIHPHFLFNTLNTIYGLALKQSKHTPEVILKLSNLLDYILYQVNKPKVLVVDETKHIQEYIELEKIRFQDRLQINWNVYIEDSKFEIAPMVLITLIENAFKHGGLIDGVLFIDINLKISSSELVFIIRNSYNIEVESKKKGIGLVNLQQRLNHHYPAHHSLKIEKEDKWFSVNLIIS